MSAGTGRGPRLAGRRILITGAASGIGAATARIFAAEGARLGLIDLQGELLASVATETGATSAVADLRDPAAVAVAVDRIAVELGGLDGLVCNAGISVSKPLAQTTDEDWSRAMDINAGGVFYTCRASLRHLQAAEQATVVNVGSGLGLQPLAGRVAYAASKAAVHAMTKVMALELAPKIRCNAVAPGGVDTPLVRNTFADPEAIRRIEARYALHRMGQAEEIAEAILFLTSFESSFVTGSTLSVDGGRVYH
jgi:NAD(P)-dependent dehydrogenase (short-subunit alcohol dehydrogenase family)